VATTDGPYVETKEQRGGILVLEARDMNHAVQLIGQHPALTYGNIFEIRPVGDMNEVMKASEQRLLKTVPVCHGRNRQSAGTRKENRGQRCSDFPQRELSTIANTAMHSSRSDPSRENAFLSYLVKARSMCAS
jgi:YCII-related domain